MLIRPFLLAAAVLLAVPAVAQQAAGKWNVTLPGADRPLPAVFDLAVDGSGKLTGSVTGDLVGTTPIHDGKAVGNKLSFGVAWKTPDGKPLSVNYSGILKGDDLELTAKWVQAPPDGPPGFTVVAKRQK